MPIYEYKCEVCGRTSEEMRKVVDRRRTDPCLCGGRVELQISLPVNGYVSGYPYHDPILGMEISDPNHRKRVLKQQGLEERG